MRRQETQLGAELRLSHSAVHVHEQQTLLPPPGED